MEDKDPIVPPGKPVGTHAQGLVGRAKAIVTKPDETWQVVARETDPPMKVFTSYVVPLVAIGPIASFIGGQLFGYGAFGISYKPSLMGGLSYAVVQYVLALAGVWLIAWIANFLSPKFGGRDDFPAAFRLIAYSLTAAWVASIVGLIPTLGIIGLLLGLYSFYLFYQGANPVMGVKQDSAIGYTAVTVVGAILVYFVVGTIAAALVGTGAMTGRLSGVDASGDRATVDLGQYGSIEVDGDNQTVDLGEMGRIEVDEANGTATVEVNGQTVTVDTTEGQ